MNNPVAGFIGFALGVLMSGLMVSHSKPIPQAYVKQVGANWSVYCTMSDKPISSVPGDYFPLCGDHGVNIASQPSMPQQ